MAWLDQQTKELSSLTESGRKTTSVYPPALASLTRVRIDQLTTSTGCEVRHHPRLPPSLSLFLRTSSSESETESAAMALQSGVGFSKILIIAGAGYTGTILLKNGKLSELIGELQSLVKGSEKSGEQSDGDSEYADAIANQVRRLANEVRQFTGNKPITVLNGSTGQMGNLSALVVPAATLGALGYGYMWWKGISFSDLMYVTKRNMEKAVSDLTKKLQHASDVIADAKKHLTQRIKNLDDKMLKQNELARSIKDDVAGVRSTITNFHDDLGILQQTVGTLDERLASLSWKQDYANYGLEYLINFVNGKSGKKPEFTQGKPKLPGKPPGLLKYSGNPNVKGLIDIVDTLSDGIDRSASDVIVQDGMDRP